MPTRAAVLTNTQIRSRPPNEPPGKFGSVYNTRPPSAAQSCASAAECSAAASSISPDGLQPLEAKAEPTVVMLQLAARFLTNLSATRTASKGCMCE